MKETSEGVIFAVKVTPKSHLNQILGWENDELKIRITAPPENGKANKKLIQFLSSIFNINQKNITLLSGENNRHKRLLIKGLNVKEFTCILQKICLE